MANSVEVVCGTYEEFLLGYTAGDEGSTMSNSFATHAHTGSVKCVATSGRWLLSGGNDDKIVVHDMATRREGATLMHHDGAVNAIAPTHNGTHVLTGGADGSIYVLRQGSWIVEKHWPKAHKGAAVNHISVHPSDKLALSFGEDRTLRTWNLVKGRPAYATNLKSKAAVDAVVWSPDGSRFATAGADGVAVWAVGSAAVEREHKCPSRALCLTWISETDVAVGLESGDVAIYGPDGDEGRVFKGHARRIKGIVRHRNRLFTASSAGDVKAWKLNASRTKLTEKCVANTDCRITCVALVDSSNFVKRQNAEEEEEIEKSINKNKRKLDADESDNKPKEKPSGLRPFVVVENEMDEIVKPKHKKGKKKIKKS